jgi:pimeloyl-ACP methyl ester carboxylesterase
VLRRARTAILSVTIVAAGLSALLTSGGAAAQPAVGTSTLSWSPCYRGIGPLECTTVQVPLDYDHPQGATVSIAMTRLPAADPATKIGSLFLNPGGPGGSGIDFLLSGVAFIPPPLRLFDVIGFDPRGIARSTALRCFGTPKQWGPYFTPFAFPITAAEEEVWITADRYLDSACEQRAGRIIDHMATADVARDLDLMREAVGDQKLTYYGISYGSYLGQTYANMFPDKVRAVAIDGVLDPIAWSTGAAGQEDLPFSTRLRSDAGAMATLEEFFRLCDAGGANCAFSDPTLADAADRFADVADKLLAAPLLVVDPISGELVRFTYQDLIANALGAMYDSHSWPDFAQLLAFIDSQASAQQIGAALGAFWQQTGFITKRGSPKYRNFVEGFPSVACSDSDNPDAYPAWSTAGAESDARFGYFGRIWTWASSICAEWPGADPDRYMGPFDRSTANPVLIIGNEFDPATRYEGAVTAHNLLPNSALLTVHAWGHASLGLSSCATGLLINYLVSITTPPPGTVCEQDFVPFSDPSSASVHPSGAAAVRHFLNAGLAPEPIWRALTHGRRNG